MKPGFPVFFGSKPVTKIKITTENSPASMGRNTEERGFSNVFTMDANEDNVTPTTGLEFKKSRIPGKFVNTR